MSWYQCQHSLSVWMQPPLLFFVSQQKLEVKQERNRFVRDLLNWKMHTISLPNTKTEILPAFLASLASCSSKEEVIALPNTSWPYKLFSTSSFPMTFIFENRSWPSLWTIDLMFFDIKRETLESFNTVNKAPWTPANRRSVQISIQ